MSDRPKILHVGGTLYWVIRTRNPDTQLLKDADSTPTVAVRKNGSSVGDSVTVTKRSATTGIYDCSYNPASEIEGDKFTLEESATVTGTTTSSATYENSWEVTVIAVERGTDGANTTAPPTASDIRTAVGLASANLDTQLGDIPTVSEFNARTILAADYATAGQATAIETDTQDIQTRLPAALVSGRIDAYVGAMASNSVTAAALATDAVSEIQAGLATSIELAVVAGYIDTEVAAIKARTDNLPNDPASASVIASAFTGVNTKLDTIDDYVDSEVAAIKTVTDKLNGMLVQDGLVWQYTANALELSASASGTVYVLPTKGTQQDRRASTDEIRIYRTEGYTLVRTVTDATGANVDLSAKTLEMIIEGENRNDKAVIPDADIDVSGTGNATYTVEIPTTVSAKADKTYNFYLWDKTTSARPKLLDNGKFIITYAGTSGTT